MSQRCTNTLSIRVASQTADSSMQRPIDAAGPLYKTPKSGHPTQHSSKQQHTPPMNICCTSCWVFLRPFGQHTASSQHACILIPCIRHFLPTRLAVGLSSTDGNPADELEGSTKSKLPIPERAPCPACPVGACCCFAPGVATLPPWVPCWGGVCF